MKQQPKIGVLALQGGFIEHIQSLQTLGAQTFEIRKEADLNQEMDALIIPGGESTTIGKLLQDLNLYDKLQTIIAGGKPVFGTCAGMILLAKEVIGTNALHFSAIDITVKRNAYGRQLGSFHIESQFKHIGTVPMTFIRAPYIQSAGPEVEILAVVDDKIVAAREKNILVTSFHPELTNDNSIHKYFLQEIIGS